jgi:hypothetical protein
MFQLFIINKLINLIFVTNLRTKFFYFHYNNNKHKISNMKVLALVSGGKDSIFNIHKCI